MTKPLIFISYSHKDEAEKEQLVSHLKVLERSGNIELWIDDKIGGGTDWEAEIKQKIAQANVVIFLISANFLTSDFILNREVPDFLKRRQSEGLTVFPIIAKNCAWDSFDWLAKMNVRPKNGIPIWSSNDNHVVDTYLTTITREIREIVKGIADPDDQSTNLPNKLSYPKYTAFQKDLENLIQYAMDDFISIKGTASNSSTGGYVSYESKFAFEYSVHNTIWQRADGNWYFTCSFCERTTLQQAEMIFMERVQEIKSILSNDWRFEEREKPDSLNTKEFEATKKYHTLRISVKVVAFNSGKNSQVDFTIEQLLQY